MHCAWRVECLRDWRPGRGALEPGERALAIAAAQAIADRLVVANVHLGLTYIAQGRATARPSSYCETAIVALEGDCR